MDLKSYELIQNRITLNELTSLILSNINPLDIHPISIKEHLFDVAFHAQNDYLGFTYTADRLHYICHKECRFKNSVYLYSAKAQAEYEEESPRETLLLFTTKKNLYVVPYGENDLSKMDWKSGKFTRRL